MADKLRHFVFMESWLDDMQDWPQKDKNEAIWRIINYGIYGDVDLSEVSPKEVAWYRNIFRVIDRGSAISAENAARGSIGGGRNKVHPRERVKEALENGCTTAKQVAEYLEGEGADAAWVFKTDDWKNRNSYWKTIGIPMDSNGKSGSVKLESIGKYQNSNGIPMENIGKSRGERLENFENSNGKLLENSNHLLENHWNSNGIPMENVNDQWDF